MSKFLETYGVAIFTLVLMAILIAFAGPLGMKIKNATTDKVCQTEEIGKDEITVATGGTVRPEEPAESVNHVYCIYYDDGEMTISQNKIESEAGRTVVKKGFYFQPRLCTQQMTTVRFVGAVKPMSCDYWFGMNDYGCSKLKEIKNIENLYTNECISMKKMFNACESLTSLDLSNFNISNVISISGMFNDCSSLTNLDLSGFDTSKVTDMSHMFDNCTNLISLDLSEFDTSNVTSMCGMFRGCKNLTSLDLSGWNTKKVTDMSDMFICCRGLTNIDLSKFDTNNVISMFGMFDDCKNLTSLNLSGWNTGNVTTMSNMFFGCSNLTSLDVSHFDTSKVINMSYMFHDCSSLTNLDLSKWNTENVTNISSMFYNCETLQKYKKTIKVSQATYKKIYESGDINIPNSSYSRYDLYPSNFDIVN